MKYRESMIEAVRQVAMHERFDFVVVDKDNKIVTRQKNKQDAKEFEGFANSKFFKDTTMGKKYKKPFRVTPISPKDRKGIGDTIIGIGELTDKERGEIDEDRKNALAGFDNRIRDAASMDRKDFIKAKELYKRKDVKGLRKHIYSLDTSPLEVVMNLISIQDRPFFDKMYPNTRGGEFLARIAYQHRHLDENIDESKDDEKKRMKGAKLKLKMGESLDEAVADLFVKKGDVNQIAVKIAKSAKGLGLKSGVMGNQVRVKGSKREVNDFMRSVLGKSSMGSPSEVGGTANPQIDKMLNKQLKEETLDEKKQAGYIAMYGDKKVEIPLNKAKDLYTAKQIAIKMMNVPKSKQGLLSINPAYEETIKEDGHTDVSSAVRQCKTITEDAMQIMGKLQSMSGEDSLPTWWTNKLAVASNSMNKMRDYLLVPSVSEEVELDEAIPKSTMYGVVVKGKYIAKGSKQDMLKLAKKSGGQLMNAPGKKVGDSAGKAEQVEEDAKMGKQSDSNLKSLMKKFKNMPKSPANDHMLKRIEKEMKKEKNEIYI